jgi:formyltetrahydrofolate-dependent phosphoribosylglycinamide formyltransferase
LGSKVVRLAVLISGYGSNLQAILDATEDGALPNAEVSLVVSNRRDAFGIKRAIHHGVPVVYFPLAAYTTAGRPRDDYDADLASMLDAFSIDWVVLAGWMHVLSRRFLERFAHRVLNLHPALPGQFPGTNAIERAFAASQEQGIDHTGVMVHLVPDEGVDSGPVVAQQQVPIEDGDDLQDLAARVHAVEHRLLVATIRDLIATSQPSGEETP